MQENDRALKAFLHERMYRHYKLNRMTSKARRVVRTVSAVRRRARVPADGVAAARRGRRRRSRTARVVADYIAGMTDRFAADEHRRLFDVQSRAS